MRRSIVLAAAAFCWGAALAQKAGPPPPVKMGLWEKKVVSSGATPQPMTMTARSCVTPETWLQMVSNASKQHPGCTMKTAPTAHGYSFSGTCTMEHGLSMTISGTSTIQDATHIVSDSHSASTINGKTREMDVHSTSTFVSAECGAVKPGEPEVSR